MMIKRPKVPFGCRRGYKKCPQCSTLNGSRSKGCSNVKCPLNDLKNQRKAVRIDSVQLITYNESNLYSVRIKDRDPLQRNFVQITDKTLSADEDGSIISRNAICFVDTCKYDSSDLNISCKHVKAATECTRTAEQMKISQDILNSLVLSDHLKESLHNLYEDDADICIPLVQRINKNAFVVKCKSSKNFPLGRLHVTVLQDDVGDLNFYCACKKLRILMSPNNSILLENEICEHLLIILVSILSTEDYKKQYQKFTNAMNSFLPSENFDGIFNSNLLTNEDFESFSENILNSCLDFDANDSLSESNILIEASTAHTTDQNGTANIDLDEDDIKLQSIELNLSANASQSNFELTECQIELMDQFQLNDQISLVNDDIQFSESDFLENNLISTSFNQIDPVDNYSTTIIRQINNSKPIKFSNTSKKPGAKSCKQIIDLVDSDLQILEKPRIEFDNWFVFVIEKLNMSLDINSNEKISNNTFSISNTFFNYLSERFQCGEKRRLPNSTTIIKSGKHKGLVTSTWIFTTYSTVKRIFTSSMNSIEFEKTYFQKSPGHFIPYKNEMPIIQTGNKNLKKILPIIYKVFIQIGAREKSNGFILEWTPDVFPQSHYGILHIQFSFGYKRNNKTIDLNVKN